LDLRAFLDAERHVGRGADPYGALRAIRTPRPECRTAVEQAYTPAAGATSCCNPTFFHHPWGPEGESMRLTANYPGSDTLGLDR
jgi:hypothetical protein